MRQVLQTTLIADEAMMAAFGARLAALLQAGDVLRLEGPLGVGKSVFARGVVRALTTPDEDVPSPTFALVQQYDTPNAVLWHMDLYRLEGPQDIWELGFEEALEEGICLIEWPSKAENAMPESALSVEISHRCGQAEGPAEGRGEEQARQVTLAASAPYSAHWSARLASLKNTV